MPRLRDMRRMLLFFMLALLERGVALMARSFTRRISFLGMLNLLMTGGDCIARVKLPLI